MESKSEFNNIPDRGRDLLQLQEIRKLKNSKGQMSATSTTISSDCQHCMVMSCSRISDLMVPRTLNTHKNITFHSSLQNLDKILQESDLMDCGWAINFITNDSERGKYMVLRVIGGGFWPGRHFVHDLPNPPHKYTIPEHIH